jgi:hypothetical protein
VKSEILFTLSDQLFSENEDDPTIGKPAKNPCATIGKPAKNPCCGQTNTLGASGFLIRLDDNDCCGEDNDFDSIPPKTLVVNETEKRKLSQAKPSSIHLSGMFWGMPNATRLD